MKKRLAALLILCMPWLVPAPAAAYQIDCAILLCLAGGFPASEPCARAKAEMIRRITPWPIEPPLQIWRCPMKSAFRKDRLDEPGPRLYDIGFRGTGSPIQIVNDQGSIEPMAMALLQLVAEGDYDSENGTADIDISSNDYDFVRSIRVFSVEYARQWWGGKDGDCKRLERVRLGTYGTNGEFGWHSSSASAVPSAFKGLSGWQASGCPGINLRAVFIEWRDHEGNYGHEQVNY